MAGCETRQEMLVLKQQGTIRWDVSPMPDSANVYQAGRFDGGEDYWKNGLELKDWVKVQKKGGCASIFVARKTSSISAKRWSAIHPPSPGPEAVCKPRKTN